MEELLRYISGGDIISRFATEDIEGGGQVIRAGEGVILATPAAFPEPDALDLRRDAKPHLTFGHGAHQCVAKNFATTAEARFGHHECPERVVHDQWKRSANPSLECPEGNLEGL